MFYTSCETIELQKLPKTKFNNHLNCSNQFLPRKRLPLDANQIYLQFCFHRNRNSNLCFTFTDQLHSDYNCSCVWCTVSWLKDPLLPKKFWKMSIMRPTYNIKCLSYNTWLLIVPESTVSCVIHVMCEPIQESTLFFELRSSYNTYNYRRYKNQAFHAVKKKTKLYFKIIVVVWSIEFNKRLLLLNNSTFLKNLHCGLKDIDAVQQIQFLHTKQDIIFHSR